jgi:hypothetical protein
VADFSEHIVKSVFIHFFCQSNIYSQKKNPKEKKYFKFRPSNEHMCVVCLQQFFRNEKKISGHYTLVDISGLWDCRHGPKQVQSCKRQFRASYQDSKILFDKIY